MIFPVLLGVPSTFLHCMGVFSFCKGSLCLIANFVSMKSSVAPESISALVPMVFCFNEHLICNELALIDAIVTVAILEGANIGIVLPFKNPRLLVLSLLHPFVCLPILSTSS